MHVSASPSGAHSSRHRPLTPALCLTRSHNPYPTSAGRRCPTGEARITPGFDLPAKFVIHTVGPIYASPRTSAPLLEAAFRCVHLHTDPLSSPNLARIQYPLLLCVLHLFIHVSRRGPMESMVV